MRAGKRVAPFARLDLTRSQGLAPVIADAVELMNDAREMGANLAASCTKVAAAHHEAGHAVLYAHTGFTVTRLRIWRDDAGRWVGETTAPGSSWAVGPATPPAAILAVARVVIAGWVSEARLLGAGDVKLLFAIGLLGGWKVVLISFAVAGILGGIAAVSGLMLARYSGFPLASGRWLPFGAALAIGLTTATALRIS